MYPKGSCCVECSAENEEAAWEGVHKLSPEELPVNSTYFLYHGDAFFRDLCEVAEYCEENGLTEVRLLVGKSIVLQLGDAEDLFGPYMPDDMDVPDEVFKIIDRARAEIAALPSVGYEASENGYLFTL